MQKNTCIAAKKCYNRLSSIKLSVIKKEKKMNIYDFTVQGRDGAEVKLADYRGKVLLIVNTATGCGFTPQYNDLQKLYEEHQKDGLEILDFPCNQFGEQAPGSNEEIHSFCAMRYKITFPQFAKVDVNGENAIPLYQYLVANSKFEGFKGVGGFVMSQVLKRKDKDFKNNSNIKWNFTKFLISRDGEIIARFEPTVSMKDVRKKIESVL